VLTKNWDPPLLGWPVLAMERVPGSLEVLSTSSSGMLPVNNKTRRRQSNRPCGNKNKNRLTAGVARDGFAVAREGRAAGGVAGAGLAGLGVLGVRAAELEHEPACVEVIERTLGQSFGVGVKS